MGAQLAKLSPRHDAIAEWLIANPESKLGDCAQVFGVTQSWLSCILHSDVFQAYYRKLRGDYVDLRVMPLRDKLHGIANRAVEKLGEQVEMASEVGDRQFLLDTAELTLGKLGYGGGKGGVTVVAPGGAVAVFQSVTPDDIARAREAHRRYQKQLTGVEELPVIRPIEEPTPEEPRNGHPVLPQPE